jgi:hypothetical protein
MPETRGTLALCALVLAGCGTAPTKLAAFTQGSLTRAHFHGDGEVTRALRLSGNVAAPGTLADEEALLAGTTLVPDENQRLPETKRGSCSVGPSELDCLTKTHRDNYGDRDATLAASETALPGRDLRAEITSPDGSVIYRASLIEHENARRTENPTVELRRPTPTHSR